MRKTYFFEILALALALIFVLRKLNTSSLLFEQINICSFVATMVIIHFKTLIKFKIDFQALKVSLITAIAISFIINLSLLNLDRSRSFYVLAWVANGDVSMRSNEFTVTAKSNEATNIESTLLRIQEGESRGLIQKDSEGYALTFSGKALLKISNFLADAFELDNWKKNKF
jgi:hypothetical protein